MWDCFIVPNKSAGNSVDGGWQRKEQRQNRVDTHVRVQVLSERRRSAVTGMSQRRSYRAGSSRALKTRSGVGEGRLVELRDSSVAPVASEKAI